MSIYCTYITFYRGNKLPPFYIGSTSVEKVNNGYRGSVLSKQYKDIWKHELKTSPHLFVTRILSTHNDRKSATSKEEYLQRKLNVVRSTMYINKSLATPNGMFGMNVKKEAHPNYGKRGALVSWYGMKRSDMAKANYSNSKTGIKNPAAIRYILKDSHDNIVFDVIGNVLKHMYEHDIPKTVAASMKKHINNRYNLSLGIRPNFYVKEYDNYILERIHLNESQRKNTEPKGHWYHTVDNSTNTMSTVQLLGPIWLPGRFK